MKITYDPDADAAYIYVKFPIKRGEAKNTVAINENIIVDFDAKGKMLGIEVLSAKKMLNKEVLMEAKTL
ncbi:DUF2283 domain-containing protein [Candidatus Woesearchaeota archaeon]|nr:DUF2283 domain-containing protein [Candidatus Woesearchaeota archaeon]